MSRSEQRRFNVMAEGQMNALTQLNKLYEIKDRLCPITQILIVGFVEDKKRQLNAHDIKFVRDVYPEYFKKNGDLKGSFKD